jgi:hypothetical protein
MGIRKYLMKPASMQSFAEVLIEFAEPRSEVLKDKKGRWIADPLS